ncbi:hypothetical protein R3P38DRAFT_2588728 [Favolaschia claudopus]|uniref:BTB domain-containing protein n=1 Tax=Favolaschia claudopus TaxID=2862362 RepID=A0AAV9Z2B2_9AGAR
MKRCLAGGAQSPDSSGCIADHENRVTVKFCFSTSKVSAGAARAFEFEDCGLIIQAENTLFRVSRDFLALQSPVFKDMLLLPPPKPTDMIDGCPFVILPDRAEDVTVFLKALIYYDFFVPHPGHATLPVVVSVLRMSDKYQVDALRKRALLHLSSVFPTTLLQYDALEIDRPSVSELPLVLSLARDLSIDWILPLALYWRCADLSKNCHEPLQYLSTSEQSQLLTASWTLATALSSKILDFLWPTVVAGHERCSASRFAWRRVAERWRQDSMPLEIWDEGCWNMLSEVCHHCLRNMKNQEQSTRQAVWDDLPHVFGLRAWSELEKMKTEALE